MAELLRSHWQGIFDPKHSERSDRKFWFDHIGYDVNLAALAVPPAEDCVAMVSKTFLFLQLVLMGCLLGSMLASTTLRSQFL